MRRRVPLDLVLVYGCKEIVRALGTADPAEAAILNRKAWVALDEEFAAGKRPPSKVRCA